MAINRNAGASTSTEDSDRIPDKAYNTVALRRELLAWFNREYAIVDDCGQTVVAGVHDGELTRYQFRDFWNKYSYRQVVMSGEGTDKEKSIPAGQWYTTQDGARRFAGFKFVPGKEGTITSRDGKKYLNIWQGFSVPEKEGDWSLLRDCIFRNVCQGNEDQFKYIMAWMAQGVQEPWDKPGVAVVMKGSKGTGKSTVAKWYRLLFGKSGQKVEKSGQVTGRFNEHLETSVLVEAGEALFEKGQRAGESALKSLITDDTFSIEPKGLKLRHVPSYVRIIMTTNEENPVPASLEDRRYCIFTMGEENMQDTEYFGRLDKQMKDGGLAAMLYDLKRYDYSAVDLHKPPMTDGLRDIKTSNLSTEAHWWHEKLIRGTMYEEDAEWIESTARATLHADYLAYCKIAESRFSGGGHSSIVRLGIWLKAWFPPGVVRDNRRGSGRTWTFPDLETCRELWDKKIGWPSKWEEAPEMSQAEKNMKKKYKKKYKAQAEEAEEKAKRLQKIADRLSGKVSSSDDLADDEDDDTGEDETEETEETPQDAPPAPLAFPKPPMNFDRLVGPTGTLGKLREQQEQRERLEKKK